MKKLSLILGILLWTAQVWAATYYIDPTCSSNGDGTTTTCGKHGPFKTWAEIVSSKLWAAGNTYSQKGGTTAYETITVGASGTAGNPITINSYGTGKAILDGGVTVTAVSWGSPDKNGVYKQKFFGYFLQEDGVFLKRCTISQCVGGSGNSSFGSGYNYYKPTSGTPAHHVTKRVRDYGIAIGSKDYVTIAGLSLKNYFYGIGTGYGGHSSGETNNYVTITGNDFSDMEFGAWLNFNNATSTGVTITNNTFNYIRDSIELQSQGDCGSNGIFDSMNVSYNTISNGAYISGNRRAYGWRDVDLSAWDSEGIGFQNLSNSNIHHNNISGDIQGIVLFVCKNGDSFNNNFYDNYVDVGGYSLGFNPKTTAHSIYNNSAYNNILISASTNGYYGTLLIANCSAPIASYNYIYNNTIIGSQYGIFHAFTTAAPDYYIIKNNIIYGGVNGAHFMEHSPKHIIIDYNLYGRIGLWYGNALKSWSEWNRLGFDIHGYYNTDPLFTNATGQVYTLTSSSPAKWAGINVGLTTDYSGKPVHNPPSIGAYEYDGTTITVPEKLRKH